MKLREQELRVRPSRVGWNERSVGRTSSWVSRLGRGPMQFHGSELNLTLFCHKEARGSNRYLNYTSVHIQASAQAPRNADVLFAKSADLLQRREVDRFREIERGDSVRRRDGGGNSERHPRFRGSVALAGFCVTRAHFAVVVGGMAPSAIPRNRRSRAQGHPGAAGRSWFRALAALPAIPRNRRSRKFRCAGITQAPR